MVTVEAAAGEEQQQQQQQHALPRQSTNSHPDCPTAPITACVRVRSAKIFLTVSQNGDKDGGSMLAVTPVADHQPSPSLSDCQDVVDRVLQILIRR